LWRQMGNKGRTHVEENMNLQKQTATWIELYESLCMPVYAVNRSGKC
jgi:hypothetical protein